MIAKLKGLLDAIGSDHIIINVGGVGYQVFCSTRTLAGLGAVGEPIEMAIETHVRETEIRLFGFASPIERDWFSLLQSVQGVGVKVALAIQSTLEPGDLASAIALQDKSMVARAPGVGPKVAQRIVTELKDKAPAYAGLAADEVRLAADIGDAVASSAVSDAISALTNLGYSGGQAAGAVSAALKSAGEDADSATLIRLGLRELAG